MASGMGMEMGEGPGRGPGVEGEALLGLGWGWGSWEKGVTARVSGEEEGWGGRKYFEGLDGGFEEVRTLLLCSYTYQSKTQTTTSEPIPPPPRLSPVPRKLESVVVPKAHERVQMRRPRLRCLTRPPPLPSSSNWDRNR